jgi:hypothetical protein
MQRTRKEDHNVGIDARMYVTTPYQFTDAELQDWCYRLGSVLGREGHPRGPVWVERPEGDGSASSAGRRALRDCAQTNREDEKPCRIWQDHEMLEVSLFTRYYGEGYERGDIIGIVATAEWLERNIPDAAVYYGGDSSGALVAPFPDRVRDRLIEHWAKEGHLPYDAGFARSMHDYNAATTPVCDFCNAVLIQYGWGPQYAAYGCAGCGLEVVSRDGGDTFREVRQEGKRATLDENGEHHVSVTAEVPWPSQAAN